MNLKVQSLKIKDMNHLAKLLTELEGKKISLPIAQVKEVLSSLNLLQCYNYRAVDLVMRKRAIEMRKARKKALK